MVGEYNYGTGRRKSSVARVFIKLGKGSFTVNGKPLDEYFARETGRMIVRQPLALTSNLSSFDIMVNVHGCGESGQAGAVRHGLTRALIDFDDTLKPCSQRQALLRVMPVRWSARRCVCIKPVSASSSPSVNSFRGPTGGFIRKGRLRASFFVNSGLDTTGRRRVSEMDSLLA